MNRSRTIWLIALSGSILLGVSFVAYRAGQGDSAPQDASLSSQAPLQRGENDVEKTAEEQRVSKQSKKFTHLTNPAIRWQLRVDFLKNLDIASLTASDIDSLYSLLRFQPASQDSESWWVVVNEVMEQMRLHGLGADRYSGEMVSLIEDSSLSAVLRDYAVQHLGLWLAPLGEEMHTESDPARAEAALASLVSATVDPQNLNTSIPGTALIALIGIEQSTAKHSAETEAQFARLQQWLYQVLDGSVSAAKLTRISAVNAAGLIGATETLPTIRKLVSESHTEDGIRLSSIATLGQLGDVADIASLEQIISTTPKFQHAASAAIRTIQNR